MPILLERFHPEMFDEYLDFELILRDYNDVESFSKLFFHQHNDTLLFYARD